MKFNLTLSLRRPSPLLLLILLLDKELGWYDGILHVSLFIFVSAPAAIKTHHDHQPASQTKSKFNFKGASSTLSLCFVSCHHGNPLHLLFLLLLYKKPSRRTFVRAYSSAESVCHKMIWDSDKRAATEFISACTSHYVI